MASSKASWSVNETRLLLEKYTELDIPRMLDGTRRDSEVYATLTNILNMQYGIDKNQTQVINKLKKLRNRDKYKVDAIMQGHFYQESSVHRVFYAYTLKYTKRPLVVGTASIISPLSVKPLKHLVSCVKMSRPVLFKKKRVKAPWTLNQTRVLLAKYNEMNISDMLDGTRRDSEVYNQLTFALNDCGVMKNQKQVISKLKKLRHRDKYAGTSGTTVFNNLLCELNEVESDDDSAAPKDGAGPGEVSWPAASSSSPGPSSRKESRPSTSTAPASFIKPDPGTPPPMIMAPINPYIQEAQLGPRILPKPPPAVASQQLRHRMRPIAPAPPAPQQVDPDPEPPQQVCLRWNSFHSNMQTMFPSLLTREKFVDVTLACEGRSIKCHKVVLSSCSSYLERLLSENPCKHPIILMPRDLRFWELRALVDFMYRGEVNVEHEQLPSLLAAAESLQVKGLAGPASSLPPDPPDDPQQPPQEPPSSPRAKRKRVSSPVARPPPPQLPNSPSVSITRLVPRPLAAPKPPPTTAQPSPSSPGHRPQSPGIEITPVVSFEEIKVEPIDISDSNDESLDATTHDDDFDMEQMDKDYGDDEIEDLDQTEEDPNPAPNPAEPPQSQNGTTRDSTDNETEAIESTPDFEGNGFDDDLDTSSYASAELGLRTETEQPPS